MFDLGRITATPGALDALGDDSARLAGVMLNRHVAGDWGEVCTDDARANDNALVHGSRILSAYTVGATKLWIITEADRSQTTLLLPEEY